MKNCTKYQSPIKIRDVAGTPNVYLEMGHVLKEFMENRDHQIFLDERHDDMKTEIN